MADGSIKIKTKLDTDEIKQDLKGLEDMINSTSGRLKGIFKKVSTKDIQNEISELNSSLRENQRIIQDNEKKIQSYQDKLNNIDSDKSLSGVKSEISKVNKEIENGKSKIAEYQKKLDAIDIKKDAVVDKVRETSTNGTFDYYLSNNKDFQDLIEHEQELNDKMKEYEVSIKNASQSIPTLNKALENAKKALSQDYSENIKKLSKESDNAKSNVSSLTEKINKLKKKLNISKETGNMKSSLKGTTSEIGKFGQSVVKSVDKGVRKLGKMALAIFSVRSAYTLVRKAASQYLETNQSVANQVQGMWTTLGNMLGPIINGIIGYISKFISYVNGIIQAFTGVNLIAKANANAMKNQAKATSGVAKATKEANAQLASFDEMNKLDDPNKNDSSGSSGSGNDLQLFTPESIDVSGIKKKLEELFEPLKNAWTKYGKEFTDSFFYALNNIWNLIKAIGKSFEEVWLNGTGQLTCELILQILTNIFNIVGNLAGQFTKAWEQAGVGTSIIQGLWDILNICLGCIEEITGSLADWAKDLDFTPILTGVDRLIQSFKPLVQLLCDGLAWAFENVLEPLGKWLIELVVPIALDNLGIVFELITTAIENLEPIATLLWDNFFSPLASWAADAWVSAMQVMQEVFDWIVNNEVVVAILEGVAIAIGLIEAALTIYNVVTGIATAVTTALSTAFAILTSPITHVVVAIGVVIGIIVLLVKHWDEVKEAASNCWDWICEKWNQAGEFFSGIWDDICEAFAGVEDWFNDTFGNAIEAIKNLFADIGEWFGERYDDICTAFENIGKWFSDKFDEAYKGLTNVFKNIGKWFTDRYHDVCNAFSSVGAWFSDTFSGAWTTIKSVFSPNTVSNFFKGAWNNITGAFGNVAGWFKGEFTRAWTAVKNVFSTGGKIFDGIKDGILNGLKAVINGLIVGINKVIRIPFNGINDALKSIKKVDILGFKPFEWIGTITVPSIPKLARGGIVNNPTLFQAGEAGKEAVLPLQNNTQWMQDLADFINSQRDDSGEQEINLYIDGERFFRWFIKKQKQREFATNG